MHPSDAGGVELRAGRPVPEHAWRQKKREGIKEATIKN